MKRDIHPWNCGHDLITRDDHFIVRNGPLPEESSQHHSFRASANVACCMSDLSEFHPWPLTTMLIQLYRICFWEVDGSLLNIALRGKGGTVHDDIDVGAWLHIHHKSVANFLPAPVKNAHPRECVRGCCT